MTVRERLHTIGMALFGPANSGPYGAEVAPPPPKPRDAHGRVISSRRIARAQATIAQLARMAEIAKATTVAGLVASRQSVDGLLLGAVPHAR